MSSSVCRVYVVAVCISVYECTCVWTPGRIASAYAGADGDPNKDIQVIKDISAYCHVWVDNTLGLYA